MWVLLQRLPGELHLPVHEVPSELARGGGGDGLVGDHEEALVPRAVVSDVLRQQALDVGQLAVVHAAGERRGS